MSGNKCLFPQETILQRNQISHYIISFDPKDRDETWLSGEQAQKLGVEYARENFPGHQALVCTHTDGHNGSGNIHVHIVINSVRKYDTEPQPYMEFDRDLKKPDINIIFLTDTEST